LQYFFGGENVPNLPPESRTDGQRNRERILEVAITGSRPGK
jgi:hypothetical protein